MLRVEKSAHGEPWIFGLDMDEVSGYLAARGLSLVEHVGATEYRERYLNPLVRKMNVFNAERVVLARVKSAS